MASVPSGSLSSSGSAVRNFNLLSQVPDIAFDVAVHTVTETLQVDFAVEFVRSVQRSIVNRGYCLIGVSGGSLPKILGTSAIQFIIFLPFYSWSSQEYRYSNLVTYPSLSIRLIGLGLDKIYSASLVQSSSTSTSTSSSSGSIDSLPIPDDVLSSFSTIDWSRCHVFLVDERCVPYDHKER